jgi:hypothetical protein
MVVCHCEAASIDFEGGTAEAISSVHEKIALSLVPRSAQ